MGYNQLLDSDEIDILNTLDGIGNGWSKPQCEDRVTKYEAVMITLAIMISFSIMFMIYVTLKFFLSFGLKKVLFSFFLIFLNLALIARAVFIASEIYLNRPAHWDHRDHWTEGFISFSGSFFFSLAGLLNIYNWVYFTLSIKTIFESRKLYKIKIRRIVNWSLLPSLLVIVASFIAGFTWSWLLPNSERPKPDKDEDNKALLQYFSIVTSTIYFILSFGFAYAGYFLLKEIAIRNEEAGFRMK